MLPEPVEERKTLHKLLTIYYGLSVTLPITITLLVFKNPESLEDPGQIGLEMALPLVFGYGGGVIALLEVFLTWFEGDAVTWIIGWFLVAGLAAHTGQEIWIMVAAVWGMVGMVGWLKGCVRKKLRGRRRRLLMWRRRVRFEDDMPDRV